jgi:hypothetical protein
MKLPVNIERKLVSLIKNLHFINWFEGRESNHLFQSGIDV